jgi:hypothetical protein
MITRAELLEEYGIVDRPEIRVTLAQEADVFWCVGIGGTGDPLTCITAKKAAELAGRLQSVGETELASRISKAAEDARKSNNSRIARSPSQTAARSPI